MSRLERMRRRLDPRRLRLGERPINASSPPPGPAAGDATAPPSQTESPAGTESPSGAAAERREETTAEMPAPAQPEPGPERRRVLGLPVPAAAAVAVVLAIAGVTAIFAAGDVFEEEGADAPAPAPTVDAEPRPEPRDQAEPEATGEEAAEEIGFPAFATKNTTRVGGSDPAANAAGVALATYPSAGGVERPVAVTVVPEDDPAAGIAAAVLTAEPVRAPILLSAPDSVPPATSEALEALSPQGSVETEGVQVFAVGDVSVPGDYEMRRLGGGDPAATAAAVKRLHDELVAGPPDHIVVTTSEQPELAAPAAAWAARSGDPVLFATRDGLPEATRAALERHPKVPVYVLGPSSAISSNVLRQIGRAGGPVRRVAGEDPVSNAIDFARYADGTFGWNINDPGHGFVVARAERPMDAVAAAPLSASGTWGPLLLTDSTSTVPGALRGYLLDVKPGYRTDPTRALYNHVWVIGDASAIDVAQQAALDDLAELTRIPTPEREAEADRRPTDADGGGGSGGGGGGP